MARKLWYEEGYYQQEIKAALRWRKDNMDMRKDPSILFVVTLAGKLVFGPANYGTCTAWIAGDDADQYVIEGYRPGDPAHAGAPGREAGAC